jgi:predicted Zn-dependent protease
VTGILLSLPLLNVATTSTTIKTAAAQELPDRLQNLLSELEVIEIVDYEISLPGLLQEESGDDCGDGSNSYRTFGGIKWRSYPVSYYIDTSGSRIDPSAAKRAVVAAFNEIDREEHPPGRFFSQVARYSDADIYVRWGDLDGSGNGIAKAKFWYRTSTDTIVHAVIVFDRAERWDALSSLSCNGRSRSPFDIQNMAVHEIGHAIGLDHVRDIGLSMYPNAAPGETLKRSLGIGDQRGINRLY